MQQTKDPRVAELLRAWAAFSHGWPETHGISHDRMNDAVAAFVTQSTALDAAMVEVSEAMVERAVNAYHGGHQWKDAPPPFQLDYYEAMRAALTAALGVEGVRGEPPTGETFQARVKPWLLACFGEAIASDRTERNHRFLEEALELVQSAGCTRDEAHQLVDYVFDRPVGEMPQEIGGVMVTLAALCLAHGQDMHAAGETELTRIWGKVEKIRAKQKAKPKHSPLPAAPTPPAPVGETAKTPINVVTAAKVWAFAQAMEKDIEAVEVTLANFKSRAVIMRKAADRLRGKEI